MTKSSKKIESASFHLTKWMGSSWSILIHTAIFLTFFAFVIAGFKPNDVMLVLTTAVSLEAIYLSLFIQMTVNRNTESLEEVEEDIDQTQEDVEGLESNIVHIHTSVKGIEEEVDDISEDIDRIQSTQLEGKPKAAKDQIDVVLKDLTTEMARITDELQQLKKILGKE